MCKSISLASCCCNIKSNKRKGLRCAQNTQTSIQALFENDGHRLNTHNCLQLLEWGVNPFTIFFACPMEVAAESTSHIFHVHISDKQILGIVNKRVCYLHWEWRKHTLHWVWQIRNVNSRKSSANFSSSRIVCATSACSHLQRTQRGRSPDLTNHTFYSFQCEATWDLCFCQKKKSNIELETSRPYLFRQAIFIIQFRLPELYTLLEQQHFCEFLSLHTFVWIMHRA